MCLSPPVCRPTSVPELYVFSNKLSALLLPPPPGLLLCGCWRLHVVTGECVYVLGPGGSVCISLRGATGSGVGWDPGKGLRGWAVPEGWGRREGLTVLLVLNASCSSYPLPRSSQLVHSGLSGVEKTPEWFYLKPWLPLVQCFAGTCLCSVS